MKAVTTGTKVLIATVDRELRMIELKKEVNAPLTKVRVAGEVQDRRRKL